MVTDMMDSHLRTATGGRSKERGCLDTLYTRRAEKIKVKWVATDSIAFRLACLVREKRESANMLTPVIFAHTSLVVWELNQKHQMKGSFQDLCYFPPFFFLVT